jgi:P27 family predicted phage terminase small subunit
MKAPNHLSAEAKRWWRRIDAQWKLDDSNYLILTTALEAFDEMRTAQNTIKKYGVVVKSKDVVKKNPALELLKISRSHFLQAWRLLNFGVEPPGAVGRPPDKRWRDFSNDEED